MPDRIEPRAAAARSGRSPARRGAWLAALAVVLAALALGLAFRLGARSATGPTPAVAQTAVGLEARLAELQAALAAERVARDGLGRQLAALEARTDALAAQLGARERPALEPDPAPEPAEEPAAREEGAGEADLAAPRAPLFDMEALVASCMPRGEAEALRARWERYELDRLRLNDRAMRESYFMRPRHRNEHVALDEAFRREVGDDGYDAFLRATGKPNGVAVREILASGAGSAAGLAVGDLIERYAGARVFSAAELQVLTASGRLGETVDVDVLRDGQPVRLRAARGPLGVVLEGVARAPEGGC